VAAGWRGSTALLALPITAPAASISSALAPVVEMSSPRRKRLAAIVVALIDPTVSQETYRTPSSSSTVS
jgi:hypothetical protein